MLENLKMKATQKAKKVKEHVDNNIETYYYGGLLAISAIGAAAIIKTVKDNVKVLDEEKAKLLEGEEKDWHDKWLYQLDGQDQNWAMYVSDDKNHNAPDYKEIGRQIADGEFRVED